MKKLLISLFAFAIVVATTLVGVKPAQAQMTNNLTPLGQLIVLNSLFPNGVSGRISGTGTVSGVSPLGQLVVLNGLFNGGMGITGTTTGLSPLGQLIVLNDLFPGGTL